MPALIDDAFGTISRIFLTVPTYATDEFPSSLRSVIGALPRDAALEFLVEPASLRAVQGWLGARDGTHIHAAQEGLDFSHWAQDALGGVLEDDGPALVLSEQFDRHHDAQAGQALARRTDLPLHRISEPYDGGNVLAMRDMVLVGAELGDASKLDPSRQVVCLKTERPRAAEQTRPARFLPEGWQEVIRAGVAAEAHQPLFHIDLFIAPAGEGRGGRPRWLVGCPRLGAEVLGLELLDHADAALFDEIADQLRDAGAEVIRSPQPLIWTDQVSARRRTWFHLPTNNVLVQVTDASCEVWLPCFEGPGWPELGRIDDANAALWESLGFLVRRIGGCLPLAERRGALRCMCNVVAREPR